MTDLERELAGALADLIDAVFRSTAARGASDAAWLSATNNKLQSVQRAQAVLAKVNQSVSAV